MVMSELMERAEKDLAYIESNIRNSKFDKAETKLSNNIRVVNYPEYKLKSIIISGIAENHKLLDLIILRIRESRGLDVTEVDLNGKNGELRPLNEIIWGNYISSEREIILKAIIQIAYDMNQFLCGLPIDPVKELNKIFN
jgi:hypothetical protein|nr:MAG TPA: hypothetical protein [Caudoviricetes sp.]